MPTLTRRRSRQEGAIVAGEPGLLLSRAQVQDIAGVTSEEIDAALKASKLGTFRKPTTTQAFRAAAIVEVFAVDPWRVLKAFGIDSPANAAEPKCVHGVGERPPKQ